MGPGPQGAPPRRRGRTPLSALRADVRGPLRTLRTAEGLYAVVAISLAMSLPPPTRGTVVAWVHWMGTGMLAATLAFRLGRPNRASWYVAALLCGYVLLSALPSAPRLGVMLRFVRESPGPAAAAALTLAVLVWTTQLVAAVSVYRGRGLLDPSSGVDAPAGGVRHDLPPR